MDKFAPLFIIVAASLWGVDGIALRPALYGLPVALVVFIETTIVALILTPFFIKRFPEIKKLDVKDWLVFIGVALTGGAIGTMAITKALFYVNYVNLSIVVLIQKLQPVFAISLAALFLKERLSAKFFIWAALALGGAYLMTFGLNSPNFNTGDKTFMAAIFSLIATISFGSSTVLSKRSIKHVEYKLGAYLRFVMTSVLMLLIVLSTMQIGNITDVNSNQAFIFMLIALSTGGSATFLYYYGLKRITASSATIYELAFPLTAVFLEYIIRGNILSWVQWIGVILLVVSIVKVTKVNVSPVTPKPE